MPALKFVRSATRDSAAAESNLFPQSAGFASLGNCRVVSSVSGWGFLKIFFSSRETASKH